MVTGLKARQVARRVRLVLALGLLGCGVGAWALSAGTGHGASQAGARQLGQLARGQKVAFSLVLALDQPRLRRFLSGLEDPRSGDYHHFIDARTFGRRFGLSAARMRLLLQRLHRDGVTVTAQYPQRTSLDVEAPAGVIERLFGVRLIAYATAGGRRFHAPLGRVLLPPALSPAVTSVAGLDGGSPPRPDDLPDSGLTPAGAADAYDIGPLQRQGMAGQGEKVAIISLAQFRQSDLDAFSEQYGLPRVVPTQVAIDGGASDNTKDGIGEADLDAEMVHAVAPQAEILNYSAPFQNPSTGADTLGEIVDRVVADGQASIVSDSYGDCELTTPAGDIQRDEQAIESAVAHGISIFKASGDAGAYQCQRNQPGDHRLSIEWPAASPGIVVVGGTTLSVSATGGYAGETAWEGTLEQSGSGGGLSSNFRRPTWQQAPGVQNRFSNGMRQVPDVSASADPLYGWAAYSNGELQPIGGTSAAAPFWAGSMALIEQYVRAHGISRLGFVDPMLYRIASTPERAAPFHDILTGSNRYYPATAGWDFATGLGSPDVYNLAQDILDYLRANPPR